MQAMPEAASAPMAPARRRDAAPMSAAAFREFFDAASAAATMPPRSAAAPAGAIPCHVFHAIHCLAAFRLHPDAASGFLPDDVEFDQHRLKDVCPATPFVVLARVIFEICARVPPF